MKIEPLVPTKPRPVAVVAPGHRTIRIITEDGDMQVTGKRQVEAHLERLSGHVVYSIGSLLALRHTTGALSWTCHTWRGKATRMVHEPSGTVVTSLRGTMDTSTDIMGDLGRVFKWLRSYGVGPGSISTMSWNLWRASLPRPVTIGADPDITSAALFGGRQEIRDVRSYQHMNSADITAAYPTAMASRRYALSLRSVSPSTTIDPEVSGIAEASVFVPADLSYGPIPRRLAERIIQFPVGVVKGTWAWCELDAARSLGCQVNVDRAWAPRSEGDLFSTWWEMALQGRALGGASGQLAKAICNSLWGQFAMDGSDRGQLRWENDRGEGAFVLESSPIKLPHRWCIHVAAETTARVRRRLLLEGIYSGPGHPVHVDTDGVIVRRSNPLPEPAGPEPGQWRIKATMKVVDVRAPQLYRWSCSHCGLEHPEWHYVAAGVPEKAAPLVFADRPKTGTRIAYRDLLDAVVPSTHTDDREKVARLVALAKELIA